MSDITLTILILCICAAIIAVIVFFRKRAQEQRCIKELLGNLPVIIPRSFSVTIDRPNTPFIQANVAIPEEAIQAITAGIQKQINSSSFRYGWTLLRNPFDYNVVFIDPDRTNLDGSPALLIHGIQSAGTCIGVANDGHNPAIIVLPHQAATNWRYLDYLKASARHESEHIAEWTCDQPLFWSFIGAGDIHPHIPDEDGS